MNNVEMKTLIKIILVCVVLFMLSPFLLGVLGIVFKIILWIILAVILVITIGIMVLKHKASKAMNESDYMKQSSSDTYKEQASNESEDDIDYGDAPIVDVYDYEESKDDE